jgi:hypothetical protein
VTRGLRTRLDRLEARTKPLTGRIVLELVGDEYDENGDRIIRPPGWIEITIDDTPPGAEDE